jgi:hypothetical protein
MNLGRMRALLASLLLVACAETSNQPKPEPQACEAMMKAGDALLVAGKKQAAYDKYEETRSACVAFHPVRKRIFQLTEPELAAPRPGDAAIDVIVTVSLDAQLGPDVAGVTHVSYLDGEIVQPGRAVKGVRPGRHQLAVEVYVKPKSGPLSPARLDVREPFELGAGLVGGKPPVGGVRVQVKDRGGEGALADRLSFTSQVLDFEDVVMLSPQEGGQRLLTDVSKEPHRLGLPADQQREGMQQWGLYKICVDKLGAVTSVSALKPAGAVDQQWQRQIWTWRFKPYEKDGALTRYCTPLRLQVTYGRDPLITP